MLGDNLKRYRTQAGLTQKELADKLGLVQPSVAQYERGTKQPSPPILVELSEIFNVTIDELVKGESSA